MVGTFYRAASPGANPFVEVGHRVKEGDTFKDVQREFHEAGAVHRERLFMAGNQLGKTVAGSFEWAMHLTGDYPDWWNGRWC